MSFLNISHMKLNFFTLLWYCPTFPAQQKHDIRQSQPKTRHSLRQNRTAPQLMYTHIYSSDIYVYIHYIYIMSNLQISTSKYITLSMWLWPSKTSQRFSANTKQIILLLTLVLSSSQTWDRVRRAEDPEGRWQDATSFPGRRFLLWYKTVLPAYRVILFVKQRFFGLHQGPVRYNL